MLGEVQILILSKATVLLKKNKVVSFYVNDSLIFIFHFVIKNIIFNQAFLKQPELCFFRV